MLGDAAADRPLRAARTALFQAVEAASKQKPQGRADRRPARAPDTDAAQQARQTPERHGQATAYYLFGPDRAARSGPTSKPLRTGDLRAVGHLQGGCSSDYDAGARRARRKYAKGTACADRARRRSASGGPPAGSKVVKVPAGHRRRRGRAARRTSRRTIQRYYVLEDDSELSGADIKNPKQATDPHTNEPIVTMEFTDKGREAFARVTKRIAAARRRRSSRRRAPPQRADLPALRDHARQPDRLAGDDRLRRRTPRASTAAPAPRSTASATSATTNDLAESLRIGALPIELKLISKTQVSATLGKQALHQGLIAGAVGLAADDRSSCSLFYRVLGLVATASRC